MTNPRTRTVLLSIAALVSAVFVWFVPVRAQSSTAAPASAPATTLGTVETITVHGRGMLVLMDAQLARRALEALEDAEDARDSAEILTRIESRQDRTYTMTEVVADLGLKLD